MTLLPSDVVELAVVERSGFVESRHLGVAVLLGPDGSIERALGDVRAPIFPRSSLKPIQAAVSVALAADGDLPALTGPELGLATASHTGTDAHAQVVEEMLAEGGLTQEDLRCPPAVPSDPHARRRFLAEDLEPERLRMNCSGKHAAMLRACVAHGWPTESYLDPGHPLQVAIADLLSVTAQEPIAAVGIDGCGAPVLAVSTLGLARAVRWATLGTLNPAGRTREPEVGPALATAVDSVVQEVLAQPWTIQGPGRENTLVIEDLGLFAKGGAEGVLVLAAPDGRVVALKVLDGAHRATTLVGLELLVAAGSLSRADADRVLDRLELDVLGGGEVVGRIRASA